MRFQQSKHLQCDAALAGIDGVHKLIDGILIEGKDYDQLFTRIETVLQWCVVQIWSLVSRRCKSENP